jgi:hypothetical protein
MQIIFSNNFLTHDRPVMAAFSPGLRIEKTFMSLQSSGVFPMEKNSIKISNISCNIINDTFYIFFELYQSPHTLLAASFATKVQTTVIWPSTAFHFDTIIRERKLTISFCFL